MKIPRAHKRKGWKSKKNPCFPSRTTNLSYILEKSVSWSITKSQRRAQNKTGRWTKRVRFPRIGKRLKLSMKIPSNIYIYTYTYIQNSSNIFTKLHPVNQTGQISKKTRYPRETIIVATRTDPASKIGTRQMRNIYVTRKHTTVRITDERITRRYTIRVFRIYNTHRSSSSITSTMSIMTILIIRTLRCRKRCLHLLWLKNLLRSLLSWTEQY